MGLGAGVDQCFDQPRNLLADLNDLVDKLGLNNLADDKQRRLPLGSEQVAIGDHTDNPIIAVGDRQVFDIFSHHFH